MAFSRFNIQSGSESVNLSEGGPEAQPLGMAPKDSEARHPRGHRASKEKAGDGLLSRNLSVAVPSALQGLTAVFGMGTGVAPAR